MAYNINSLPPRPNRTAAGYLYTSVRCKHKAKDEKLKLFVFGTFDTLAKGHNYNIKKIKKEHPIDNGYFKEVYILTDIGRNKLKRLKCNKIPQ